MTMNVTARTDANGRAVAVKTAVGTADADRLEHEAGVLDAARHPGVVELVGFSRDGDGAEMITAHAGIHSLATLRRLRPDHAAGVVAALASTVADLHGIGIVHGRIDPSHVLLGAEGRPILCGFSGGGRRGTVPPRRPSIWAARRDGEPLDDADDVAGLGAVLRALLGDESDGGEPIPDRRGLPWRRSWTGYHRSSLLTLADRASADDPAGRGTALELANAILDAVPDAALPAPADPAGLPLLGAAAAAATARPRIAAPTAGAAARAARHVRAVADDEPPRLARPALARRPAALGVAVAGLAMFGVVFGSARLLLDGSGSNVPVAAGTPPPTTAPAPVLTDPPSSTTAVTLPSCPGLEPGATPADVDGDGCPDAVHVDGDLVSVEGARWTVGESGDSVLVGDWNCDGIATVAVVRPGSGEVFVFDGWAATGTDLVATAVPSVAGARTAVAVDRDGDGCPELMVSLADGRDVEVE
jgi:hypothetical protein